MAAREQYLELPRTDRELRPTYLFMMKCLLYSRMETGLVSNKDFYDEDVNVYIAHLLNSFIHPAYLERSRGYLSKYDTEVFRRLETSKDARLKYTLYKTNADFLLISLGIFDNAEADPAGTAGPAGRNTPPSLRPAEEAYIGRGRTYYRFAYSYSQQIHGRHTPITEVLEKLSDGFDKYMKILSHMRGEYLDLLRRLSRGEVYHLERAVNADQRDEEFRNKQDRVLDLYLEWKKTQNEELRSEMRNLLDELKTMRTDFKMELPEA